MPSFQTPSPHNDNPWDWNDANIEAEDIRTRNRRATMAVGAAVVVGSLGAVVMFSGINGVTPSSVVSEMSEVVSEMSGAVYGHDRSTKGSGGTGLKDSLVQYNWPGLSCEDADDDYFEWPYEYGSHHCVQGDTFTCAEWGNTSSDHSMWQTCKSACNSTQDDKLTRLIDEYGSYDAAKDYMTYSNDSSSWFVVCAWEGIKQLPALCEDKFTASVPTHSSHNRGETIDDDTGAGGEITFEDDTSPRAKYDSSVTWDSCNVHAFCYICTEIDGTLNDYCEAVLQKYSWEGYRTPSSIKSLPYEDTDYWCSETILTAIKKGTYKEGLLKGIY